MWKLLSLQFPPRLPGFQPPSVELFSMSLTLECPLADKFRTVMHFFSVFFSILVVLLVEVTGAEAVKAIVLLIGQQRQYTPMSLQIKGESGQGDWPCRQSHQFGRSF